ncbi:MAG: DinB family protein [Bacteroidota bacterium]
MKIQQANLITELRKLTQDAKVKVASFSDYPLVDLQYKAKETDWSILECIEHLNRYGNFYLPEIENSLIQAQPSEQQYFKSGLIGNYFVNMIKADSKKKMKTTKSMDTTGLDLGLSTIEQFLKQLARLDTLLEQSAKFDLNKVKTAISLTTLIQLKLGDTLRFVVYHNERHVLQASKIVQSMRSVHV